MGSCVICGTEVDGHICRSHEEDVCFEFTGSRPDQLTVGRFYRGSVDGIADFGVFVDVGDHVTGLLHESELDRRLESVTWEPGDTLFVQVKNVRDNGNVDLGWSIRQGESEYRGSLIDTGSGEELPEGTTTPEEPEPEATSEPPTVSTRTASVAGDDREERADDTRTYEETPVGELAEAVGEAVRLDVEVVDVRQTSGPTIFEVRDATGTVECAAFEAAGVRAYPEADVGDVVAIEGLVERRRGDLQVETEALEVLAGDERGAVLDAVEAAVAERARPDGYEPLAENGAVSAAGDAILEAATAIRRAVFEGRPVVVRHDATVDGFVGGAAVERAVLATVRDEHEEADAVYHYVDRRPLDGPVYDMEDAMRDVTAMLQASERHDERVPLFVFVDAAATAESVDGLGLLSVYDAESVVVDGAPVDAEIAETATAVVDTDAPGRVTGAVLAAEVAAAVDPDRRSDLRHLPALSYWREAPAGYVELAESAGYDAESLETLRQAIALEAFYQAHGAKRELVDDLLFGEGTLAERASEQYRERLDRELRTAEPHLERWETNGAAVGVLDTDAFTHRYEFPPARLLLAALADGDADLAAVVGVAEDELLVWGREPIDVRTVADRVREAVPAGGVEARGGHDGSIVFLAGERDDVVDAAVDAVAHRE